LLALDVSNAAPLLSKTKYITNINLKSYEHDQKSTQAQLNAWLPNKAGQ